MYTIDYRDQGTPAPGTKEQVSLEIGRQDRARRRRHVDHAGGS